MAEDNIDDGFAKIMAGEDPLINPATSTISHTAHDIVTNALRLESARAVGVYNVGYRDGLLISIKNMRAALDTMEKWAKLEKPTP